LESLSKPNESGELPDLNTFSDSNKQKGAGIDNSTQLDYSVKAGHVAG